MCILGLSAAGLSACEDFRYPQDPNDTLDRVLASDRMRVIAVDHVPWVIVDGSGAPKGAEVELVKAFAQDLGVTIEWRRAPAFEAMEALKRGDADLAIGGFTQSAVTAHKGAAQTYAYFTEELVVAADAGAPVPQKLDDQTVFAEAGQMIDGLIREEGGIPVSEKRDDVRLVALPRWKIPPGRLVPTGIVLHREKHVMAVPRGENAWIMRLELFLRRTAADMGAKLREASS